MNKKTQKKKLVIVESPVKAKTIGRFLGSNYLVESCMGHIRDLPNSSKDLPESVRKKAWAGLGVDVENNFHPFYCIPKDKKSIVKKLKEKAKSSQELILATDEDREGESIAWHLTKILSPKIPVKRMVFHEITKVAIQSALKNCRSVDSHLVQAQEARRILDRLVGYSISPVLWKKITRGLSAGRVQSVAVSLISHREMERLNFQKTNYWDVIVDLKKQGSVAFLSRLIEHNKKPLVRSADFDSKTGRLKNKKALLMDEKSALKLQHQLKGETFEVTEVTKKQVMRKPPPPFITSTLQQEGNRKLGFSSKQTMGLAQKLYEQGLITYMRTDSTFLSAQALRSARTQIASLYGKTHLPPNPRVYRKTAKGAQEAHEAIRPAGQSFTSPEKTGLSGPALSLYTLIWKRTLASQMKDCRQNQVRVQIKADKSLFQSSGTTIVFPGFYLIYKEDLTEDKELPTLNKGEKLKCLKATATAHETKPPSRYTEASLIQKLEQEGVGRPSTYASIISTIQDRDYVKKEKNSLIPTFTALVVNRFLHNYFPDYVDLQFTAEMEKDLDNIARGQKNHIKYLKSVYLGPKGLKKKVSDQEQNKIDKNDRSLSLKGFEDYSFNVGPFGPYVSKKKEDVSASLPVNIYPGEITKDLIEKVIHYKVKGGRSLGKDPKTGQEVFVAVGKYGPYVKMDLPAQTPLFTKKSTKKRSQKKAKKIKPKTMSLSPFFTENEVTLKEALKLLELPKVIGIHPETKKEIKKSVGRFGPYIVHEGEFRSVPKDGFFDIDLKYAVKRLREPKKRSSLILKELGTHPKTQKAVQLMKGKFGPYIKHSNKNYSLPSQISKEKLTLPEALKLIEEGNKKQFKKQSRPHFKNPVKITKRRKAQ